MVGRQPNAPAAFTPGEIPENNFQRQSGQYGREFNSPPPCKAWRVISTQQIVDDISCTEFCPNQTKNVEDMVTFISCSNIK